MGTNRYKPELITAVGRKPVGKDPLPIPSEGLELILSMPKECELDTATLSLRIGDKKEEKLTCDFTSGDGADKGPINWQIADWGCERPVIALEVSLKKPPKTARIKVFHNGVWLPLTPVDIFTLKSEKSKQYFPAVFTSKLMVEFVEELKTSGNKPLKIPGAWVPDSADVTETKIFASSAPYNVNLSIANEEPFFSHQGVLPGEVSIPVNGIKEAVNRFLDESGRTQIPLTITAGRGAQIKEAEIKINFEATLISVAKKMAGLDEEGRMKLSWSPYDVAFVTVGKGVEVHEVEFTYRADPGPEQLLLSPESTEVASAHLCDDHHAAAQCFEPLPQGKELTGLELYLRAAQLPVTAQLSLYADTMAQPAQQPLPAAVCEINIEAQSQRSGRPQWIPCSLPKAARLNEWPWWAVLSVETGELHWFLSDKRPGGVSRAMYRIGDNPWRQRLAYGESKKPLWSLCRLVVSRQDPAEIELSLRCNGESVGLTPGPRGHVRIAGSDLAKINNELDRDNDKPVLAALDLELVVKSNVSGSVVISNPRIRFRKKG